MRSSACGDLRKSVQNAEGIKASASNNARGMRAVVVYVVLLGDIQGRWLHRGCVDYNRIDVA
jgi:hypothetical protein